MKKFRIFLVLFFLGLISFIYLRSCNPYRWETFAQKSNETLNLPNGGKLLNEVVYIQGFLDPSILRHDTWYVPPGNLPQEEIPLHEYFHNIGKGKIFEENGEILIALQYHDPRVMQALVVKSKSSTTQTLAWHMVTFESPTQQKMLITDGKSPPVVTDKLLALLRSVAAPKDANLITDLLFAYRNEWDFEAIDFKKGEITFKKREVDTSGLSLIFLSNNPDGTFQFDLDKTLAGNPNLKQKQLPARIDLLFKIIGQENNTPKIIHEESLTPSRSNPAYLYLPVDAKKAYPIIVKPLWGDYDPKRITFMINAEYRNFSLDGTYFWPCGPIGNGWVCSLESNKGS